MTNKIMLVHFGRSGSTVIAKMLAKHTKIAWFEEIVTLQEQKGAKTTEWQVGDYVSLIDNLPQPKRHAGYEVKPINFYKNSNVKIEDVIEHYHAAGDTTFIFLQRHNTLRRYISAVKASKLSLYHVKADDGPKPEKKAITLDLKDLHDYDSASKADNLVELLRKAKTEEQRLMNFFEEKGIDMLHLTYEEHIEQNPLDAYNIICSYMMLGIEQQEITLRKTSAGIRNDIENFDEVKAALAGSEFEWMVEE
ncbi:Stf0 family sulfotransferase [Ponticaulis sp.]|uniref:Stf0 family sulfotransferase n=1 Tax=Ponticaulis sp. TaxID=2020902 RepID=UPI002611E4A3|nr:Stf0 family sulfotransferase [Ponticaulis sp.]MDF1680989.1 Stf0 family sulfotransferase [Ponticaulis sp.]